MVTSYIDNVDKQSKKESKVPNSRFELIGMHPPLVIFFKKLLRPYEMKFSTQKFVETCPFLISALSTVCLDFMGLGLNVVSYKETTKNVLIFLRNMQILQRIHKNWKQK